MGILSLVGLLMDLAGALLLVLGDPPAHRTLLLKVRYMADKIHPVVSEVKKGHESLMMGCKIYREKRDAIAEKPSGSIEIEGYRQVNQKAVTYLYRASILKDNFFLLEDEFSQSYFIHSNYKLYKIERINGLEAGNNKGRIDFAYKWVGPERENRDEYLTNSEPIDDYEENLIHYINSRYIRTGSYLLIIGFLLQILALL